MAITKISPELRLADCGVTANLDGSLDGTGKAVYIVEFDNADAPGSRPYIARDYTEAVGGVKIPGMWESHPYDPWIFVTDKKVSMYNGPFIWQVTCTYEYVENPLLQPYTAEWLFASSNEPIDRDRLGKPITNSADEPFDPPITEEAFDLVLRIQRNEATYNPLLAAHYKRAVNQDTFLWFPPQTVKCSLFEGVRQRVANLFFARVTYEFGIRVDTYVEGGQQAYLGWRRRLLDQGLRTKTDGQYALIRDADDNPVTSPVPLNGSGAPLADGADPVFLLYETKDVLDFSLFGFSVNDPPFLFGTI